MTRDAQQTLPRSLLLPIGLAAFCAFLWPALLTFHPGDWPSPNQFPHNTPTSNACGIVGAWWAYQLHYFLGDGAYPLALFGTLAALVHLVRGSIGSKWERCLGLVLVVACTSSVAHLIGASTVAPLPVGHGGLIGHALGELLTRNLSRLGTVIVLLASGIVGLIFATQGWVLKLPGLFGHAAQKSGGLAARARKLLTTTPAALGPAARRTPALDDSGPIVLDGESVKGAHPAAGDDCEVPGDKTHEWEGAAAAGEEATRTARDSVPAEAAAGVTASDVEVAGSVAGGRKGRTPAGPIVNFPTPEQAALAEPYPRQIENWRLPPVTLLNEPEYCFSAEQEVRVRKQAQILEQTLEEFRLDARVVEIDTGPVITMFELKLGAGIKVSQIATLSNDIARALKAHAIRVVAPISGKNTVGIEVPNTQKEMVRLRELMTLAGGKASEMALPLFLGKDAGGAALVADLTAMPHLLIAGTTGSGKSVSLSAIVLSLLMTKRPDHVKMIIIDPKMVEMSQFKEVPHLMCPLVTDMVRAQKILEWAVTKMEERYELIAEARVKNIAGYNSLGAEELYARFNPASEQEKARISTHLPYVVIIIDELADLMMTAAKEVEHHLSRLAQKSRAVGIHIIVATQRPEVKVVTGLIKSNLPARICFRVASRMDSRIVLDQNGGEVLMGQGDMLFLPPGCHKLVRAQGTYLEEGEVHAILDDLGSRASPEFHPELVRLHTADGNAGADVRDPLFDDAVRIIIESKRGSVSLLQRRLTIGYSRASRLIDQMAAAGIVGDYKGSQAREVIMTMDQWEAVRSQMEADREAGYEADQDDTSDEDTEPWYDAVEEVAGSRGGRG